MNFSSAWIFFQWVYVVFIVIKELFLKDEENNAAGEELEIRNL